MLRFLGWSAPDEDSFASDVRIVLVSEGFSKELTTAVLWLNSRDINIRCIRLQPYRADGKTLIDVQQVVPLSLSPGMSCPWLSRRATRSRACVGGPPAGACRRSGRACIRGRKE